MMNKIQKCSTSNIEKVDDIQGRDLLSDLPLEIIHRILALIPIEEVVRTSVLSTQWRYTWTTLPQLVFNHEYEDFITWVLSHHEGPLHMFRMDISINFQYLDEWILSLSRKDIREITLLNYYSFSHVKMQSSIYSCTKLTYLRLRQCGLVPPPSTFKGFLFLKCLSLHMVGLSPDQICNLVAVCPLLETFDLVEAKALEIKITSPNLKRMRLRGRHQKMCINAPLMTEISVDLFHYNIKGPACDYAKCFGGFSNLQKLYGNGCFTKYLNLGIKLSHHPLVFHHLKLIDLYYVDFKDVLVVAHLVIGAPNLQELKIRARSLSRTYDVSNSEALLLSFRDLVCQSNFKLKRLTDVSLSNVHGLGTEVEFLKFLLEISPALKTMSVVLIDNTEEKRKNLRAKLERCNWASPTVKFR